MVAPGNGAKHFELPSEQASGSSVLTPIEAGNAKLLGHPEGGNAGGTGGAVQQFTIRKLLSAAH